MKPFIGLGTVVASGFLAGCSHTEAPPTGDSTYVAPCPMSWCHYIETERPTHLAGGSTINVRSLGPPCRFEVSWQRADAAADSFRATFDARVGEVFALHGYVVRLHECHGPVFRTDHFLPPSAAVIPDPPDFQWAAPDADNVFIPLSGEATLEGDHVARAALGGPRWEQADSVTVSVADAKETPTVYRNLRTGDSFRWGTHRAAIVQRNRARRTRRGLGGSPLVLKAWVPARGALRKRCRGTVCKWLQIPFIVASTSTSPRTSPRSCRSRSSP